MKKMSFALQVFASLTVLPLYVVVEMNHATAAPAEKKIVTEVSGNEKKVSTVYPQMRGDSEHLLSRAGDKHTLLKEIFSLTKN